MRILWNGPRRAKWTFILAHGAGAAMRSPFMQFFAEQLSTHGVQVGRFNFPYMTKAIAENRRRPPDRAPKLLQAWNTIIANARKRLQDDQCLAIGGKSMGGRMASMSTDQKGVQALICLGYPFHPPGNLSKLRIDHLPGVRVPAMIVQGERDAFGNREQVQGYRLPRRIKIRWLPDGDHGFQPRKSSGLSTQDNWMTAIKHITEFLD